MTYTVSSGTLNPTQLNLVTQPLNSCDFMNVQNFLMGDTLSALGRFLETKATSRKMKPVPQKHCHVVSY